MQQLLEQAFASINRGQYSAAKVFLQEIINSSDLENFDKKNDAHLAMLDINKNEKKVNEYQKSLITYLSFLNSEKKYEEVINYISELESQLTKYIIYFQTAIKAKKIEALEGLGHFQKEMEETDNYLKSILELKQYDLAEIYVEKIIKKFPHQVQWQLYLIEIYLGKYQYQKAIDKFQTIALSLDIEKKISWCSRYTEIISNQHDDSKITSDYFETINCLNFKKPEYTKLINTLINQPSFEMITLVCKSFANTRKFNLAKTFLAYLEKNHKKQLKKVDRIFKKIKDIVLTKRNEEIEAKPISSESIQEIKLEHFKIDLSYIKKYGDEESYKKLLKKIIKIDPFFVEEVEADHSQETHKTTKSIKKEKPSNPDEILRNLLSEISYYSTKPSGKENVLENLEKELSKTIEIYQDDILNSNYHDYIMMLYSFKLYEAALLLVNKVKERLNTGLENLKAYLEISYLEIILKNEMGKTYDSLEILNFILSQLPLSRDEKVCFLYMAGESYYQLGQGREAAKYYRKILKLTDGYRLTKDRMKLLEKV